MVGIPPQEGYELIEGRYLLGIAAGHNQSFESGLTAKASGNQSNGTLIPADIWQVEFDTVATNGDSCVLPFAVSPGTQIVVINNGAATLDVYSNPGTNPVTAAADKLNNSTSAAVTISAQVATTFYCAKAGVWTAS